MQIESVHIDKLIFDPANVRTHDNKNLDAIKGSLAKFGQQKPIVINSEGIVVAGNGTLAAAKALGWRTLNVVRTELEGSDATAYAIADNRTADLAEWDDGALAEILSALQIEDEALLTSTGFSSDELAALVDDTTGINEGQTDPDEVPEAPEDPTVQPGQIWAMGDHRLMCGDATKAEDVAALMNGQRADLVFTDPPYNIAEKNKGVAASVRETHAALMRSEWDRDFSFQSVEESFALAMAENCSVYVCTSHHLAGSIWEWMDQWADHFSWCVWSKPNPMPSLTKRHWTWCAEMICYATRGKHTFNFPPEGHALSVWGLAPNPKNDLHPTQKPVHVPAHAISHSSGAGQLVADLFMGSGSTLIACEQLDRDCYGMEIDPVYCDVVIKRWEDFTGKTAELVNG